MARKNKVENEAQTKAYEKYQEMIRKTCEELNIPDKLLKRHTIKTISKSSSRAIQPESSEVPLNLGDLKEVIKNLDTINIKELPKKIIKSLKHRGHLDIKA